MSTFQKSKRGGGASRRTLLLSASAASAAACTPRGTLGVRTDFAAQNIESVWAIAIGEQRPVALHGMTQLEKRSLSRFARHDVSIPEIREIGEIDWPGEKIDPARHFLIAGLDEMQDLEAMLDQIEA